jgi:cell division septation protein DedD
VGYALQLASVATRAGAEALAAEWQQKGVQASVVEAEIPGRGTVYRLRVSGLSSRAVAEEHKARLGQGLVVAE